MNHFDPASRIADRRSSRQARGSVDNPCRLLAWCFFLAAPRASSCGKFPKSPISGSVPSATDRTSRPMWEAKTYLSAYLRLKNVEALVVSRSRSMTTGTVAPSRVSDKKVFR
ncbi:hypothetical protein MishRS11D_42900 (plasmid) [Methylomagnum ishizawai]|nr:hypothetical protein MishRS11D_42900 [Methylomagnum ishizawai]